MHALAILLLALHSHPGCAQAKIRSPGSPPSRAAPSRQRFFSRPRPSRPDFWALIGYYVPQMNGAACSVASLTLVMNAALRLQKINADDALLTQTQLLQDVTALRWKDRITGIGVKGEMGLALDQLGEVTKAALTRYGLSKATVETVHTDGPAAKKKFVEALKQNEKGASDFIVVNFVQKAATDDADVGHISVVGAYDEAQGRILILDTDREYYEPYWVGVDALLSGMGVIDPLTRVSRGYVWIRGLP